MELNEQVVELGNKLPADREYFQKVTTSPEQKEYVINVLLPELKKAGIVSHESIGEFMRAAIREFSQRVRLEPVTFEMKSPGRKTKIAAARD